MTVTLKTSRSFGIEGVPVDFIDNDILVMKSGNCLCLYDIEKRQQTFLRGRSWGMSDIAVCRKSKVVAYAEKNVKPTIYIYTYPLMKMVLELSGATDLEYKKLAFSRCGTRLVAVTGIPEPSIIVWHLSIPGVPVFPGQPTSTIKLVEIPVPTGATCRDVQFNPKDNNVLCCIYSTGPVVYRIVKSFNTYSFETIDLHFQKEWGEAISQCWTPGNELYIAHALSPTPDSPEPEEGDEARKSGATADVARPNPPQRVGGYQRYLTDKFELMVQDDEIPVDSFVPEALLPFRTHVIFGCESSILRWMSIINQRECFSVDLKCLPELESTTGTIEKLLWGFSYNKIYVAMLEGLVVEVEIAGDIPIIPPHPMAGMPEDAVAEASVGVVLDMPSSCVRGIGCVSFTDTRYGLVIAEGSQHSGTMHIFETDVPTTNPVFTQQFPNPLTAIEPHPDGFLCAFVDSLGYLFMVDCQELDLPRLVFCNRIHNATISLARYEPSGKFLALATPTGRVYLLHGSIGSDFGLIGYLTVNPASPAPIVAMSWCEGGQDTPYRLIMSTEAGLVAHAEFPGEIPGVNEDTFEIAHEAVNFCWGNLRALPHRSRALSRASSAGQSSRPDSAGSEAPPAKEKAEEPPVPLIVRDLVALPSTSSTLAGFSVENGETESMATLLVATTDSSLRVCAFVPLNQAAQNKILADRVAAAEAAAKDGTEPAPSVEPTGRVAHVAVVKQIPTGHQLPLTRVVLSRNKKMVITGSADGAVAVRSVVDLGKELDSARDHDGSPGVGGVGMIAVAPDAQFVFSAARVELDSPVVYGHELCCDGNEMFLRSVEEKPCSAEPSYQPLNFPMNAPDTVETVVERRLREVTERRQPEIETHQTALRSKIKDLKERFMELLDENDQVPDLEKMERLEFVIDKHRHDELVEEGEKLKSEVRQEIEYSNLCRDLIWERVKKEFWDSMERPSRAIEAFASGVSVECYSIIKEDEGTVAKLESVKKKRKAELVEQRRHVRKRRMQRMSKRRKKKSERASAGAAGEGGDNDDDDDDDDDDGGNEAVGEDDGQSNASQNQDDKRNAAEGSGAVNSSGPGAGASGGQGDNGAGDKAQAEADAKAGLLDEDDDDEGDGDDAAGGWKADGEDEEGSPGLPEMSAAANAEGGEGERVSPHAPPPDSSADPSVSTFVKFDVDSIYDDMELGDDTDADEELLAAPDKCDYLLYHPLELVPNERKRTQMTLLDWKVNDLKLKFNTEHDALMGRKLQDIEKITERLKRIQEIYIELSNNKFVSVPKLSDSEVAERVLEVRDDEVKAERVLSEEQQKKLDEDKRKEEERRKAAAGDNFAERALYDMMYGKLQLSQEKNPFENEPVKPEILTDVQERDMNEEQLKALKDYEEQMKTWAEDREKHRKNLETEVKKLQTEITEVETNFDNRMQILAEHKMHMDSRIYQVQLWKIKLQQALVQYEEDEKLEKELFVEAERLGKEREKTQNAMNRFKREMDIVKEKFENMVNEDKQIERSFRRDFADAEEHLDFLFRLFKRRHRGGRRGSQASVGSASGRRRSSIARRRSSVVRGSHDGHRDSMDGGGPGRASRRASSISGIVKDPAKVNDPFSAFDDEQKRRADKLVEPLDATVDRPEGFTDEVLWQRLIDAREAKIELEQDIKKTNLLLEDMQSHYQRLVEDDEQTKLEWDRVMKDLEDLRAQRKLDQIDCELLFTLKQGQVEVEQAAVVTDYTDACLCHRSVVEALNERVVEEGHGKVLVLKEIKDFRKGIAQLQWENKRAVMLEDDLVEKTKDFQLLRVTRSLQELIKSGVDISGGKQSTEVSTLEKRVEHSKRLHLTKIQDKKRHLQRLERQIEEREAENSTLETHIRALSDAVRERARIYDMHASKTDWEEEARQRMKEVVTRRKLLDLARMQTEEVEILREELDRNRQRTFPSFANVNRQIEPPDLRPY
eukprot:Rmarinus@m.3524